MYMLLQENENSFSTIRILAVLHSVASCSYFFQEEPVAFLFTWCPRGVKARPKEKKLSLEVQFFIQCESIYISVCMLKF